MISEQNLTETLTAVLGPVCPKSVNVPKLTALLNACSESHNVELSAYGYIMWVLEHYGMAGIYKNMLMAANAVDSYGSAARKYKEDMPALLVNASQYVDKVFNTIQDPDLCMTRLEGMAFPYVLYVLFAAAGQTDSVIKYRPEIEEQLRRYPGTLDLLPARFKAVGEEVLNANIK